MEQSAFLEGHSMLDSIVVVNELIHDAQSRKKGTLIFKADFEKAYDSVRWDLLFYMLRRMNFHDRWNKWIKSYITSARVSVLVNKSPFMEFGMERGWKQGDPCYKLGRHEEVTVSLLQFADDTLFIGEGYLQNQLPQEQGSRDIHRDEDMSPTSSAS
ncbi:uncharacterized protein LOC130724866 [Lotus japonicus]|uniref:uncharacterized protein LOC130724866 n=1 Tax=Lotus japonicus TaxID=34305 RepID=UPI00258C10DC|nr:uncharacterized protein LOC130724866 [Lotus japonicus]